jgi:hypothetical protein
MFGAGGDWRYDTGSGGADDEVADPGKRAVSRARLLDLLDAHGSARAQAEAMLHQLTDAALVLPGPGNDGAWA